jgi:glucosamine--fructose-6-phosphate aminotransferase (isomerizing)
MLAEMREQPRRVHDAFSAALPQLDHLGSILQRSELAVLLGRGSSRSAATYGARALRVLARRPAFVASPADLGWGEWTLPLDRAVAIAISQSGESREMLSAAERARERGATLLVVTNTTDSTLAGLAESPEHVLSYCAGAERAVPATKTFTASLACLLAIACAGRRDDVERARDELPGLIQTVLEGTGPVARELAGAREFVLAGEGYGEAIAEEGAIKLRETLRRSVASFETSELLHGSINSSGAETGVITLETDELSLGLAREVVRAANDRGATTVHVGATEIAGADAWIPLPVAPPAWAALLAVLPIQLAARSSALAQGLDPDQPEGLNKVTLIDYAA